MSSEQILRLNDEFRQSLVNNSKGKLVMTAGVASLPKEVLLEVIKAVITFNDFNDDNDPHKEHDFGVVEIEALRGISPSRFYWKIDYYDLDYKYMSDNPADPSTTNRVLTLLLPEEY